MTDVGLVLAKLASLRELAGRVAAYLGSDPSRG